MIELKKGTLVWYQYGSERGLTRDCPGFVTEVTASTFSLLLLDTLEVLGELAHVGSVGTENMARLTECPPERAQEYLKTREAEIASGIESMRLELAAAEAQLSAYQREAAQINQQLNKRIQQRDAQLAAAKRASVEED